MLYYFFVQMNNDLFPFGNLFKYISFRMGGALLTSLLLFLLFGNCFISFIKKMQIGGQPIRESGLIPENHLLKSGTPTMGGLLIILIFIISVALWCNLNNAFVLIVTLLGLSFCCIGFYDDFMKIRKKNAYALSKKFRIGAEIIFSLVAVFCITKYLPSGLNTSIFFPFVKGLIFDYGLWLFIPFGIFVIVGSANAVNITDGLDGLSSLVSINVSIVLLILAYIFGRFDYSMYLHFPNIIGVSELSILMSALIGSLLGFLWYNSKPAQIFMGDTGSLAIGAIISGVAIILKSEFVFAISAIVLIVELLSSLIQIISINCYGKKIFLMAPLHHHFELKGMKEEKIVIRFWILSIMCALIALSTLKIR